MTRGRKKAKHSKLAGERLQIAKECSGKTYEGLVDDKRWRNIVEIIDDTTIRRWVRKGLPENRIAPVAKYFAVSGNLFTDETLSTKEFKKVIYARLYERGRRTDKATAGENASDGFDWASLVAEMRVFPDRTVYGDRGYTLKDIFLFQDARFKRSGWVDWEEIGCLKTRLEQFDFANARSHGKPVILYGDFGIGKTSFLKMLAAHLVETESEYLPVFIPLRELPAVDKTNLIRAICGYLDVYGDFSLKRLDRKLLLLLDGFDELNFFLKDENWIKTAFHQLVSLYRYPNVHLIISSRPILFLKEEENIPEGSPVFDVMEFEEERIAEWIDRWKAIRENADSDISVENLRDRNLLAITQNPLLLYMTAKIFDSELTEPITYSRGLIYKLFYDWTIKGKFKKEREAYHLPENYRQLLQNIAMCMRSIAADDGFIDYDRQTAPVLPVKGPIFPKAIASTPTSHVPPCAR